jgi:hypothetical protein
MTKTESHSPVELDELPPWDDEETITPPDVQSEGVDTNPLSIYGFDSEQRTLVGLGPLERARRLRAAAAAPDSQRMPPSEPPGPFIADDELPASFRRRKVRARALAMPAALLVGLAIVGVVRGVTPHEPVVGRLTPAVGARAVPAAKLAGKRASRQVTLTERDHREPDARREDADEARRHGRPTERTPAGERAAFEAAPPTVKLPDLAPTPTVVDRSDGDSNAGSINVTSTPPSNVVLDGRPLGKSPRVVRVPAGPHTLVFIHPLYGRRSVNVKVRSGATTGASAEF